MKLPLKRSLYLLLLLCLGAGCESFLDEKPDKQQVVPATLTDFQALLDNHSIINHRDPTVGEISAGDFYLTDKDWAALSPEIYRRQYTWEAEEIFEPGSNDWFYTYRPVYTANTVLESISQVERNPSNQEKWDNVKGQALFVRARAFLLAATLWSAAYEASTASTALGIPLRLGTDFSVPSTRATLQETFTQIITDLEAAAALLPVEQVHPVRPSKAAAYALLARTYLYMGDYRQVETYADLALELHSDLTDFNDLQAKAPFPLSPESPEIIYRSIIGVPAPLNASRARIDTALYNSYAADDLRKVVYFRSNGDGTYRFKGSYEGSISLFSGIATDEVYLMRAEARAKLGKVEQAMDDLNTLLATRWKAGTFVPFTAASQQEAVELIRRERRKELLMRNTRWMDIKRLNKEGAGITLTRQVNGQTYTLVPNDLRYALPIPEDVIALSGMQQNPR